MKKLHPLLFILFIVCTGAFGQHLAPIEQKIIQTLRQQQAENEAFLEKAVVKTRHLGKVEDTGTGDRLDRALVGIARLVQVESAGRISKNRRALSQNHEGGNP